MIWVIYSIRSALPVSIVLVLLVSSVGQAGPPTGPHPQLIEVFTTSDLPVMADASLGRQLAYRKTKLRVYELDHIQRLETDLSKQLLPDPERARHIVVQRIQRWDKKQRTQIQNAALGLVKAVQYRVDRYPAIILDGEIVIYGVSDLRGALNRYQRWRQGEGQ